jgi:hypothetical protein
LIANGYYQNHVDNNIVPFGCSHRCLFLEHGPRCVFIKVVINFMFNGIAYETIINDGTRCVRFSMTSFVTRLCSYTNRFDQNSIHYNLFFILKFVVQFIWIPIAALFGMSWFIALTTYHICSPSYVIFLLHGWWFQ